MLNGYNFRDNLRDKDLRRIPPISRSQHLPLPAVPRPHRGRLLRPSLPAPGSSDRHIRRCAQVYLQHAQSGD
ncbi:uncharacterized protein B0H18DRAFT_986593 [Fomitopsis serialis]|uniref:uncharacterized protein n=1 Tax=Fomitopsis serialis TaxID=139415 RepID=UPI00200784FE|nr:uncharacterized protein B0H18DRAFT_986593 [Neoantrodia serialis]KAH9932610.1 hypothetical protein B0H18DRAFT_986593 [Neoantrodia serialis]